MHDHTGSAPPPASAGALAPEHYREVLHRFDQGFCVVEVVVDAAGSPVDYRFLEVNPAFERLTGLRRPVGRTARELLPRGEFHWVEAYGRVLQSGESVRFVQFSAPLGRWFEAHASRVGPPEGRCVAVLFTDVTAHRREQEERQRAEEALRESEHRFRAFADTAPAILWVTERDGRCSYLSRGWYEFTGQTPEEALGHGWLEAVHPADRDEARERFLAANAVREGFASEHRLRRATGQYRWVIDVGNPRVGPGGTFDGYVGSVIDIHDRKIAEERLDLAVNSGEVGLWYCDLPFETLVWNRQVKEHFGLPPDAHVTIDTFFDGLHPDDREPTRTAIEAAIRDRTTYDAQYRTVDPGGRTRWIRAIGRARYEGDRPVRFDGITVDVTELMNLRDAAEAANRAKDDFLAMLGHELRNPLAPILTALQLLKLRGIDEIQRERAVIERQVKHLVALVDDLLDVSRITRGKIDLRREPLDLADVVARSVEMASPLLEQQRHALDVNVPRGLIVDGDARRLAQVVANLLTNAAKYTESGGTVTVTATAEGDDAVLTVRDNGIGIDSDMLPRIFDLFVQERQTLERSRGGLGLGLTIARRLVELHGGSIAASSLGRGRGAAFTIRLPRVKVAAEPPPDPAPRPGEARQPIASGTRVLVVDDNQDAAELLGQLLETFGYEIRIVHDGPSALAAAETFEPHLALLDIGLPVMDGFELADRMREHPRLAAVKLIAVTGYGQERDQDASRRAGFMAHLVKPVDADKLRLILAEVAEERNGAAGQAAAFRPRS